MGIIEKIVVSDELLSEIQGAAQLRGVTVEQEVLRRIESAPKRPSRDELVARSRALRASMPPQKTDSLQLLREDRDR